MTGVPRIARFLRRHMNRPDLSDSAVYHWARHGFIPTRRMGKLITASKTQLRETLERPDASPADPYPLADPSGRSGPERHIEFLSRHDLTREQISALHRATSPK
jgi:hypothetical protein